jgi:type IV secretory pathway VirB10-like protein
MPTDIENARPEGAGRAWLIALVGLAVLVGLAMYITREKPKEKVNPNEFASTPGAGSWADKETFTAPRPAPAVAPSGSPHVPIVPQQVYRQQGPACDQACEARQRLLAAAEGSDMNVKVAGSNTLELNQAPPVISARPGRPHTVAANSWLYAELETAINSDRPGDVIARTTMDTRDTVHQEEVLIPTASKLHGKVKDSFNVNLNNPSVMVLWDSLQLPNGAEITLPNLPSADVDGAPGLSDKLDRHIAQTWIPSFAIAAVTAAGMIATTPTFGSYQDYSPTSEGLGQFGSSLSSRASSNLQQMLQQVRPTITVRAGTLIRVLVTRDLPFDHAYEDQR